MPAARNRRRGAELEFRPTTATDLPELLALWNDGRVMGWVGFPDGLGWDGARMRRWFDRVEADPRRHHFVVRAPGIGFCGEFYYAVDPAHRRAGLDIKFRPEAQGGGRAFAALSRLIRLVFEREGEVDAVWTEPSAENPAARTLYWSCGLRAAERPADLEPGIPYWELARSRWPASGGGRGDALLVRSERAVDRSGAPEVNWIALPGPAAAASPICASSDPCDGGRIPGRDRRRARGERRETEDPPMTRQPWIERSFAFDLPASLLPNVIERLRGTPARLEERLRSVPVETLRRRPDDSWSILENTGHLVEVESLWQGRLDDFDAGLEALRSADMENRRTHDAGYNARKLEDVLREFRTRRALLVGRLERLDEAGAARAAWHPRLGRPMRVIDLAVFAADHDDHHLARITEWLERRGPAGPIA